MNLVLSLPMADDPKPLLDEVTGAQFSQIVTFARALSSGLFDATVDAPLVRTRFSGASLTLAYAVAKAVIPNAVELETRLPGAVRHPTDRVPESDVALVLRVARQRGL